MKFRLTSGGSRGRGPPPPPTPPTSFFDQIEARRADKKFLETAPRLPQGLNDRPPPRRLISRSGSATANIRQLSLGPTLKKHVQQIEGVQRRAARFVKNCYTQEPGTVTNLLNELNWIPLKVRRIISRLTLFHKAIRGDGGLAFPNYVMKRRRHSGQNKFIELLPKTETYKNRYFWELSRTGMRYQANCPQIDLFEHFSQ